jgi:hypothetical protein
MMNQEKIFVLYSSKYGSLKINLAMSIDISAADLHIAYTVFQTCIILLD